MDGNDNMTPNAGDTPVTDPASAPAPEGDNAGAAPAEPAQGDSANA